MPEFFMELTKFIKVKDFQVFLGDSCPEYLEKAWEALLFGHVMSF
jgi:hypothetical protein